MIFKTKIEPITITDLRNLERDIQSAIESLEYDEKRLAQIEASLPKQKAKIESLRNEFAEALKIFKAQP